VTQKPPPRPWRLEELTQRQAEERLRADPRLILPVGALERRGAHLPLGADLFILGRLADDLSARTGVPRAPIVPYGGRAGARRGHPGTAALSRKALHRVMNELIAAWEEDAGVREVLILTAHAAEAHLEALSTIRTVGTVRVVDIFGFDFRQLLQEPGAPLRGGELEISLFAFLRPDLLPPDLATPGALDRGRQLYAYLLDRLVDLCFPPPGIPRESASNLL